MAGWLALLVSALTSFCGLGYQQVLALTLSDATGDFILSQSITLGLFLLGMGLGALRSERVRESTSTLLWVEWTLSVVGLLSPVAVHGIEILFRMGNWHSTPTGIFSFAAPLVLLLGFLTGFELPLLIRACPQLKSGSLLGAGYAGAFFGAIGVPIALLPLLDVQGTALALGLINLTVASLLLFGAQRTKTFAIHLALCGLMVLSAIGGERMSRLHLQAVYFGTPTLSNWLGEVIRIRTRYQWIDILPPEFSSAVQGRQDFQIYLDRKIQLSSSTVNRYHESMALGGANLLGHDPKRVLILGGGDGLLAATLLKRTSVQKIDLVELDEKMLELARHQRELTQLNEHSLDDPRVSVHLGDAFQFVRETGDVFDLILVDLPFPYSYELSLLYSMEFYRLTAARLSEDGVMVLDFPLPGGRRDHLPTLLATLRAAELTEILAFGTEDFFVAVRRSGSQALAFEVGALVERMSDQTLTNLIRHSANAGDSARVNSVFFPVRFDHMEERDPDSKVPRGLQIPNTLNPGFLAAFFQRLQKGFKEIQQVPDVSWTAKLKVAWDNSLREPRDLNEDVVAAVPWPRFQIGFEGERPAFQWFDVRNSEMLRSAWNESQCVKDHSKWSGVFWTSDLSVVEFYKVDGVDFVIRRYLNKIFAGEVRQPIAPWPAPDVNNPLAIERAQTWREKIQARFLILPRSITAGPTGQRVLYP